MSAFKKNMLCLTLILVFPFFFKDVHGLNKLNVDILYEALCPDSLRFVRNQLHPSWKELEPYINIHFVPFGKSQSINDGESFQCQHGPGECNRNKIMSCALQGIPDQSTQVEYVKCAMVSFFQENDPLGFAERCATEAGLQWSEIMTCYNSNIGTMLQLQAERETQAIKPKFVPTILYNKTFDQVLQNDSIRNFKQVACSLVSQTHPNACS
ncbi:GILT-like protein 1 isoform X2 [Agrilus planipennis]|uniref:GILT-like protein 1 isoform X2 n=1 Tax=Agrilus planipennis TaxID=224129 RepID=A0A1W4WQQ5_AGRPL|nr:GILT-like protein 1 isoform X2 [Agrilus planipennis]